MWSQSSPDQSSCSSDTGDVLIRSTRVPPGPGSGPGPVQITVQKLRDPPGQDPDPAAPQPGRDLLTSRFDAGGRGLVLTALSRRSHSVPHRREVKVQLLDPGPLRTSSQNATGVLTEAELYSGCHGDAEAIPLIESHQALRMVTGHAPVTSDLIASAPHLQVSHLETTVGFHSNQEPNRAASITMETGPVAMATPHHDLWPEQNSQGAVMRTNETLRETKLLLTPEDSLKTTTSGPDSQQSKSQQSSSQQSRSQQSESQQSKSQQSRSQQSRSQQSRSQQSQSQQSQSHQSKSQSPQSKSRTLQSKSQSQQSKSQSQQPQSNQSNSQTPQSKSQFQQSKLQSQQFRSQSQHTNSPKTQSHQSPFQSIRSQPCQTQFQLSQHLQSVLVQRRPVLSSTLEEAGLVLRQVRRRKKVLEENLEALLRARTGEVLHCQLDALAANRDLTEEVRIKKTVDAWISTLTKDIQVEMSSEEAAMTSQQKAAGSSAPTGRGKSVVTALRGTGSEPAVGRGSRGPWAEPDSATGELYLARLYGRAPYEGLRRTLKKSPYLRFSSPAAPPSRKPRPRLVESVTGVKVESRKTQTSPGQSQRHDIISSSHLTSGDPADLTVTLGARSSVAMAIPLGRPRTDSSARCHAERQQEVTSPPAAPPTCSVVAVDNGAPELQSQKVEQLDALPPPLLPPPPPSPVDIIESKSEEEDVFPGTKFLSVADVVQQEELSFEGEEEVQLDGGPSPPPVLYQGPVFPPQTRSALPTQDQASVLDFNLQRDVLENRLVEWVEQQLMSRMISEMYRPPPPDHAQNDSTDQSESEEQSTTSDIVEVAGGGGLQLFVDSNMSVDSDLIRELVSEVLTEQVTLLLGQRDSMEPGPEPGPEPAEPGPESTQEDKLVSLVPTPVPTPPPSPAPLSPAQSSRETPPLITPLPSEPTSLLNDESLRPITAPEPVATPTSSPEPAPSTGSPPAVHQAPPPLTWGDVELPLDEERPEEQLDTRSQLLVMSVAEEEPFFSSPLPPPSTRPDLSPSPLGPGPGPEPGPASSSSSPEDSSCTSSSTVTAGPEAALKQISEGELLLSVNQPAAMTEDSVFSFSSSLQELQEMDFDPISEGQVKGHDLLKTKEQRDTQPEV